MERLAAGAHAANASQEAPFPYPPSWVDRLTGWVQGLPGPAWLYYLGLALVLSLVRVVAAWGDGSVPAGDFLPGHIFVASIGAYLLFVIHYLDDRASTAISDFRPVLNADDRAYETLRYRLTTMPARPATAWAIVGVVLAVGGFSLGFIPESRLRPFKLFTSTTTTILDYIGIAFAWALILVLVYHTIRQLRLVSRIYTQHTNINIFDTGPLYALSRVTALTAIALLFINYLNFALSTDWQVANLATVVRIAAGGAPFVALAVASFVWPLLGAHGLLQKEKARRKSEVAWQMEAVTADLHRHVSAHDLRDMEALKDALDGLVVERGMLDKVSTWPWEPESLRAVVTALLLPVVLWIVTRALERLGF